MGPTSVFTWPDVQSRLNAVVRNVVKTTVRAATIFEVVWQRGNFFMYDAKSLNTKLTFAMADILETSVPARELTALNHLT